MDPRQILSHNLLSGSQLFDGDLLVHTHTSLLVGEIEHKLDLSQWSQESTLGTHVVVDFMSKMQQMQLAQFPNLGVVIDAIIISASFLFKTVTFTHLVLDSEIEMSLKDKERMRPTDSITGIDIIGHTYPSAT